jgi:glycosyltransferase involved in cell wall biosynthesis
MAKVSIIIPTYNVEMYLVECMESVIHQTLKDIEIICINDGSTDGSLEILKSYAQKDDRIVLVDKENGGYGIAMNIGLEKATGEYIGIVEPDDFVKLDMYESLYQIAKDNDLDFVKADFYRFKRTDEDDMNMVYNHLSKNPEDYNKVFNPSEDTEAIRYIMNTWSGIYKKEFIEKHHIRHNETPGASFQDNGFWFQTFIFATRAMIVDKPYYMNRRDNPNSSVHNREKVYCMNIEYDHIRDILMEYPELWERFKGMYWYKKYNNYIGTIRRIGMEYRREFVERFSAEFKRGLEKNELDPSVFSVAAWKKIQVVAAEPDTFYKVWVVASVTERKLNKKIMQLERKNQKLSNELAMIKSSKSYRIGRILLFIPRKLKEWIKGSK